MKKVKDIIKRNPEPAGGKNVDPGQLGQYSAKYNVSEGSLEKYLSAKGINPNFVSTNTKIAHSKSAAFMKWKKDHVKEDMTHDRDSGDARSKDIHSPTLQRQKALKKSKLHYLIKPVTTTKTKNPIKEAAKSASLRMYLALQKAKQDREREERLGHELLHGKKQPEPVKPKNEAFDRIDEEKEYTFHHSSAIKNVNHLKNDKKFTVWHYHKLPSGNHSSVASGGNSMTGHEFLHKIKKKEYPEGSFAVDHYENHIRSLNMRNEEISSKLKKDKKLGKEGNQMTALTPENHQPTMQDRVNNARVGDTIGRTKVVRDFMFEDIYADNKAATQTVDSPGEGISEKKKQMSKSARMIKALYKKHRMVKEDLYDHEKEDKSVATYGKKPKFDKAEKDEGGEKKPSAAATLTGGTTLTGEKRDDVEIDPMMRARPGQPDPTKKDDKKGDKKEDKKKDK